MPFGSLVLLIGGATWFWVTLASTRPETTHSSTIPIRKRPEFYCRQCGHVGYAKNYAPGSIIIEIFLWCLMILPGLFYTIWRHSQFYKGCKLCGSKEIIPADSPIALKNLHTP
jgi:hypothetical protein